MYGDVLVTGGATRIPPAMVMGAPGSIAGCCQGGLTRMQKGLAGGMYSGGT
jgi:hypothetical protein